MLVVLILLWSVSLWNGLQGRTANEDIGVHGDGGQRSNTDHRPEKKVIDEFMVRPIGIFNPHASHGVSMLAVRPGMVPLGCLSLRKNWDKTSVVKK